MSISVKFNSEYRDGEEEYVKIGGVWRNVSSIYVKVNGIWKLIPLAAEKGYEIITSSKIWTCPANIRLIDVFLVGGGYNGGDAYQSYRPYGANYHEGAGGAGGRTYTRKGISVEPGTYSIQVGASNGGSSTAFGISSASGSSIPGASSSFYSYTQMNSSGRGGSPTNGSDGVYAFGEEDFDGIKYGASGASGGYSVGRITGHDGSNYIWSYSNNFPKGGSYGGGSGGGIAGANGYGAGGSGGELKYSDGDGGTRIPSYRGTGGKGGSGCVIIRWGY